jgi:hypothetical protein
MEGVGFGLTGIREVGFGLTGMVGVGFGPTGMAWNEESRFCLHWNGLEWRKSVLS